MEAVLNAIIEVPTVFWSLPMALVLLYWSVALLGLVDVDTDMEVDLEVGDASEGVDIGDSSEGVDVDVDSEVQSQGGWIHSLFEFLGIGTVPLTMVLSLLTSTGWIVSFMTQLTLGTMLRETVGNNIYIILSLLVCAVVAFIATGYLVRPMTKFFHTVTVPGHEHLIGQTVTITSSSVSDTYGTAETTLAGGTSELLLNVVSQSESNMVRGDSAVIVGYDEEKDVYEVHRQGATGTVDELMGLRDVAEEADGELTRPSSPGKDGEA